MIEHALGPRPEHYGQVGPTRTKRSLTVWPRIAHAMRWPVAFIPRLTSSRRAWPCSRSTTAQSHLRQCRCARGRVRLPTHSAEPPWVARRWPEAAARAGPRPGEL